MKKRVVLGLSGGVDSSVAAYLLREEGYDVSCLFMKNWDEDEESGVCTAFKDADDAFRVANKLGLKYHTVNFEDEYKERVFSYFLRELKAGRTPNPDVMCNQEIKFAAFLDFAMKIEADYIAFGHYARKTKDEHGCKLLKARDLSKDQSYFLSRISEAALRKTIFPIGDMLKSEVRELARREGLITADKKDSTGICFIGERNFDNFINQYLKSEEGDIVDVDGGVVGRHKGLIHYTLGQRKGIGLGGIKSGEAWFVASKDVKNNRLYVCQGEKHPALYSDYLVCEDFVWISNKPVKEGTYNVKTRYRQPDIAVELSYIIEGAQSKVRLDFRQPVKAITPGQIAVLYDGDVCLGGGIIERGGRQNGL